MDVPGDMTLPEEQAYLEPDTVEYEYEPWLLDDHPLRSYPTECIPGLLPLLGRCYQSVQKRCKVDLLRVVCLLLASLAAFHCLPLLLSRAPRIFSREASVPQPSPHNRPGACAFPDPDPRPRALSLSLWAGCDGVRSDLWVHEGALRIGDSGSGPGMRNALQRLSLDLLLTRRGVRDIYASLEASPNPETPVGLGNESPTSTFLLILDAKSPREELYPHLVVQLDSLRQRGFLTYWDGDHITWRPVMVVVTGDLASESDCSNHSYSDVFWPVLRDAPDMTTFTIDGLQHLSPLCLV